MQKHTPKKIAPISPDSQYSPVPVPLTGFWRERAQSREDKQIDYLRAYVREKARQKQLADAEQKRLAAMKARKRARVSLAAPSPQKEPKKLTPPPPDSIAVYNYDGTVKYVKRADENESDEAQALQKHVVEVNFRVSKTNIVARNPRYTEGAAYTQQSHVDAEYCAQDSALWHRGNDSIFSRAPEAGQNTQKLALQSLQPARGVKFTVDEYDLKKTGQEIGAGELHTLVTKKQYEILKNERGNFCRAKYQSSPSVTDDAHDAARRAVRAVALTKLCAPEGRYSAHTTDGEALARGYDAREKQYDTDRGRDSRTLHLQLHAHQTSPYQYPTARAPVMASDAVTRSCLPNYEYYKLETVSPDVSRLSALKNEAREKNELPPIYRLQYVHKGGTKRKRAYASINGNFTHNTDCDTRRADKSFNDASPYSVRSPLKAEKNAQTSFLVQEGTIPSSPPPPPTHVQDVVEIKNNHRLREMLHTVLKKQSWCKQQV